VRLVRDESERLRRMEVEERREAMASAEAGVRAAAASAGASGGGREGEWEAIPEWILAEGRAEEERVRRINGEGGNASNGNGMVEKKEEMVPKPTPSTSAPAPMAERERSGLCVICCDR